jgi:rhodanese-related sulfurtransferase
MKKIPVIMLLIFTMLLLAFPVSAHEDSTQPESTQHVSPKSLHHQIHMFLESVPANNGFLIAAQDVKTNLGMTPDFVILDVRDAASYANKHIAGSLNIPLSSLHERLSELPKDKRIYVVSDLDTNAAFAVFTLHIHDYTGWIVQGGISALQKQNSGHVKH